MQERRGIRYPDHAAGWKPGHQVQGPRMGRWAPDPRLLRFRHQEPGHPGPGRPTGQQRFQVEDVAMTTDGSAVNKGVFRATCPPALGVCVAVLPVVLLLAAPLAAQKPKKSEPAGMRARISVAADQGPDGPGGPQPALDGALRHHLERDRRGDAGDARYRPLPDEAGSSFSSGTCCRRSSRSRTWPGRAASSRVRRPPRAGSSARTSSSPAR